MTDRKLCFACPRPTIANQMAHIIGNTILNRRLYGKRIIDHKFNVLPACNLAHNKLIDIDRQQHLARKIVRIIDSLDDESDKRAKIEEIVLLNIRRKQGKVD